jgi:hypothetical protein
LRRFGNPGRVDCRIVAWLTTNSPRARGYLGTNLASASATEQRCREWTPVLGSISLSLTGKRFRPLSHSLKYGDRHLVIGCICPLRTEHANLSRGTRTSIRSVLVANVGHLRYGLPRVRATSPASCPVCCPSRKFIVVTLSTAGITARTVRDRVFRVSLPGFNFRNEADHGILRQNCQPSISLSILQRVD